ncbi:polysaccharide lyase [Taklimakanibacter lacteus]|uniref:polysaccharide lyase n=1 Tax=Taklimakanibacter lacteus TaxID=2268456 RepID=UPI000E65EBED
MRRFAATGLVLAGLLALGAQPAAAGAKLTYQDKLVDGFEGADFAPEGGLYYKKNFEQSAGTFEFQDEVVHRGKRALRLSVKPLCPVSQPLCSERAEIWERSKLRVPYDTGVWYGFAVKFAEPLPQDDHRYLVAQWKREIEAGANGDFSPFLAFRYNEGKFFITVETNLVPGKEIEKGKRAICAPGETAVWLRPDTNQTRALVAFDKNFGPENGDEFTACTDKITVTDHGNKLPAADSGWIDFAVYSKPGPEGTGHIEIFANDKWIVTVKGRIGHNDKGLGENQYFKFGPYRAGGPGVWALYYDDFRRSLRCADVTKPQICPFP